MTQLKQADILTRSYYCSLKAPSLLCPLERSSVQQHASIDAGAGLR
ncbi:uncharacterized protein RAG0_10218 [Rhynchosporium agropyri]|uniref:Uncharacterized protein n=1 Tax=Rhynchosporium agropyri TaxID=914238 RepID=A0A1E1KZ02_9HELO|nr:uncharacterized protein RAG0_10218 [Rhynchosporium agropyri]